MNNYLNILLVEDLELAQRAATNILTNMGHRVMIANCGEKALNFIITHHFDLILLDLDLPDMNGFDICETIKSLERRSKQKIVIALTAHLTADLPAKCRRYGIDDFIIKPLSPEKARYAFSKYFSLRSS